MFPGYFVSRYVNVPKIIFISGSLAGGSGMMPVKGN